MIQQEQADCSGKQRLRPTSCDGRAPGSCTAPEKLTSRRTEALCGPCGVHARRKKSSNRADEPGERSCGRRAPDLSFWTRSTYLAGPDIMQESTDPPLQAQAAIGDDERVLATQVQNSAGNKTCIYCTGAFRRGCEVASFTCTRLPAPLRSSTGRDLPAQLACAVAV